MSENEAKANIGVVGLAVMGSNLARNLASRAGNTVAIFNRSFEKTQTLMDEHPEAGFVASPDYQGFADSIAKPRTAIILVQAGRATDAVIDELVKVFEPGDVIIDGGNALFTDTIRREAAIRDTGIHFVGAGVSGGEEGALTGPSIMPGGSDESWEIIRPILRSIAAVAEGEPCVTHVGHDGAGHFVKMIHNGIEYADMQLIAEAYDLIRRGTGKTPAQIADIFAEWNKGELESYLIEITASVLATTDKKTGRPIVDVIRDQAGQKGTGRWSVIEAQNLGIPATAMEAAVAARSLSSFKAERERADELYGAQGARLAPSDRKAFTDQLEFALFAGKIAAYAQGFAVMEAASREFSWDLPMATIARIWRAGCIIRSQFLDTIASAYGAAGRLSNLLIAPEFVAMMKETVPALRRTIADAASSGVPVPALSSALAYFDSYRQGRGTANLIQAQRDFFGAHGFERFDEAGTHHGPWH